MANGASPPMGKEKKESLNKFAKGGTTKMFSKMGVQESPAGTAAPTKAPSFDKAAAKGGKGKMFGKQAADAQAPGVAGHSAGTSQSWGVKGGKGKMFGPQQAGPARPGAYIK